MVDHPLASWTVGHTVLGSAVAVIVEPDPGFEGFWAALKARADRVDVAPTVLASASEVAGPSGLGWTLLDVAFTSLGGVRIGGWLVVPADERVRIPRTRRVTARP
jgi:cephalosporin-C deacetylase